MNHSEIEACVIRAKTGCNEDSIKIFEQFRPFIFKTAKQYKINSHDSYDLAQIGYMPLVNAVTKYCISSQENLEEDLLITEEISELKQLYQNFPRMNLRL